MIPQKTQIGIGWRPEIALAISRRMDLEFVEIVAENYMNRDVLPEPLSQLIDRKVKILPHCISLAPGAARLPDKNRLKRINKLANKCSAKMVSDHICFVRAGGIESGHLLPVQRSKEGIRIAVENVKFIQSNLSVPFALENIASLCDWENSEYDEANFFAEILEKSDCLMLLDLANLYANSLNHGFDALAYLKRLPLGRLAYVHVAGGQMRGKFYHDTHAEPIKDGVYKLLEELCKLTYVPRVMLERDDNFPTEFELNAELDTIKSIVSRKEIAYA